MDQYFVSAANSVKAEVLYDMGGFSVDQNKFYAVNFKKTLIDQQKLCFNLYRNHIANAKL